MVLIKRTKKPNEKIEIRCVGNTRIGSEFSAFKNEEPMRMMKKVTIFGDMHVGDNMPTEEDMPEVMKRYEEPLDLWPEGFLKEVVPKFKVGEIVCNNDDSYRYEILKSKVEYDVVYYEVELITKGNLEGERFSGIEEMYLKPIHECKLGRESL